MKQKDLSQLLLDRSKTKRSGNDGAAGGVATQENPGFTYDLRKPLGEPSIARRVGKRLSKSILKKGYNQVVGEGLGAYPAIGAITSAENSIKGGMIRKRRKGYDLNRLVEGPIDKSKPAVIIDDLVNTGKGLRLALKKCREEGLKVVGAQSIAVLGDPAEAEEKMKGCGIWFDSLFIFQ